MNMIYSSFLSLKSRAFLFFFILFTFLIFEKLQSQIYFEPEPIYNFNSDRPILKIVSDDYNGDGLPDIFVHEEINQDSTRFILFINKNINHQIVFSKSYVFKIQGSSSGIISGDFDNDLNPDLIISARDSTYILKNKCTVDNINFDISTLAIIVDRGIVADINNDEKLDIICSGSIFKNISSTGQISFEHAWTTPFPTKTMVAVADFDNDEKKDLVVCWDEWPMGVVILRNKGIGDEISFEEKVKISHCTSRGSIVPGYIDNDDLIDIAFINTSGTTGMDFLINKSEPGSLKFYEGFNNTGGTLRDLENIVSINFVDLNNDLIQDIVFLSGRYSFIFDDDQKPRQHNGVSIITGVTWNRQRYNVADDPRSVTFSDFDSDGDIDMAIGSYQGCSVSILLNKGINGELKFNDQNKYIVGTGPESIAGADIDNDGKTDLVTVHFWSKYISVLRNCSAVGQVSFEDAINFPISKRQEFIKFADFNQDGKMDIVTSDVYYPSDYKTSINIFINKSTPENINLLLLDSLDVGKEINSIDTGDIDGDNKPDILSNGLFFKNTSSSDSIVFQAPQDLGISNNKKIFSLLAFINDDNLIDIVTSDNNGFYVFINESTPENVSFISNYYCENWNIDQIRSVDIDDDNKNDLIIHTWQSKGVTIYLNNSNESVINFASPVYISGPLTTNNMFSYFQTYLVTDLVGDAKPDLLLSCSSGHFTILENNSSVGNVVFYPALPGNIVLGDRGFYVDDLDGDGKKDIAATRWDWSEVNILRTSDVPFITKLAAIEVVPIDYQLEQNYPNPFNPTTIIKYQLPKNTDVSVRIYNVVGQLVRVLVDEKQIAGNYSINWDGKDNHGLFVSSGLYFYMIRTTDFVKSRKMLLIR
ncbi:MAG: FG-GAP-like repeat-containing protein [bacterium]|nr:FG-GAP-like repeat-containing protein [bacterium]